MCSASCGGSCGRAVGIQVPEQRVTSPAMAWIRLRKMGAEKEKR